MKKIILLVLFIFFSGSGFAYITTDSSDPNVKTVCMDGEYSTSTGSGACSYHGGIDYYIN
ncbi:hypothetical protein FE392_16845 [Xenorhabdus sp. 12]|uniref:DUF3761 domain-containing protein n=1 Tax=Xenorhabdus santafensis TaxID=2582833 RepID=A0ABU4SE12_9GAMM|nr:hypothetical protein [Xenorhabdus sp. 12]MDX7988961.1 hypothetical protein [Xenorhabdus sp. 12]